MINLIVGLWPLTICCYFVAGHFLLTHLLMDLLIAGNSPSRIINVSSVGHLLGTINFEDLMMEKGFSSSYAYFQSKLANILFTRELAHRLQGSRLFYIVHEFDLSLFKTYLGGMEGWVDLSDWLHTEMVYLPIHGHRPSIVQTGHSRELNSRSDHNSDALSTTLASHLKNDQNSGCLIQRWTKTALTAEKRLTKTSQCNRKSLFDVRQGCRLTEDINQELNIMREIFSSSLGSTVPEVAFLIDFLRAYFYLCQELANLPIIFRLLTYVHNNISGMTLLHSAQ